MTDEEVDSREQGIEFGALAEDLENETYPLSHEQLLAQYGDRELELADGQPTLRELLEAENETEYEDAESVRQAIFMMVGDDAVGREGYTDRGGSSSETDSDKSA